MNKESYLIEIENRLTSHFSAIKDGYKVPGSERHRLEGFMQAAVFMGLANNIELAALMEKAHFSIFEKSIEERRSENTTVWPYENIDYEKYEQPTHERRGS